MGEQVSFSQQPALIEGPTNGGDPSGGAEREWVRDLADGQIVEAVFAVRERELRQRRNGGQWLRLSVCDRSGTVEAVIWEGVEESLEIADPGSAVHIKGRFGVHPQYGPKITVEAIRRAAPEEFVGSDLADGPTIPVERLEADLRELLETVQNPQLRELLDRLFDQGSPVWARFREAPAAKYYHQAYRHGLLDHTVSVAQAVSACASAFSGVDRDIAVAGALLHDIGKTMAYNDDPLGIDLTDAGRLQGEIPLGYYLVRREIERIDGFDPELAQAIFHIVLSHHGTLENGSPVIPATREATLVHALDNLGGKLGSFDRIERGMPDGEAWSRFDRGIDSAAYFRSRAA
jgi:3'-5' exoribonuclease